MVCFETSRDGNNRLWVKTPYPTTRNTWGFFVKEIFPAFRINDELREWTIGEFSWPEIGSFSRWTNPNHKYLLRATNPNGSEKSIITDGEDLYWTHADLPDEYRAGLSLGQWGVIYIPHPAQIWYIGLLEDRILGEGSKAIDSFGLLKKVKEKEGMTISNLFERLKSALAEEPDSMGSLREQVLSLRKKVMGQYGDFDRIRSYGVGKLPLSSYNPYNTIEGQTEHDFFINLDNFFKPYIKGEESHFDKAKLELCMGELYKPIILEQGVPVPGEATSS